MRSGSKRTNSSQASVSILLPFSTNAIGLCRPPQNSLHHSTKRSQTESNPASSFKRKAVLTGLALAKMLNGIYYLSSAIACSQSSHDCIDSSVVLRFSEERRVYRWRLGL